MTRRRLRTADVLAAVLALVRGTDPVPLVASLSDACPAAIEPLGDLPDTVPDFLGTVPERLDEFVDGVADDPANESRPPAGGWW